ncbi:hypothetical protein C491_13192 [Natronococcus amylolyticus DSM 10524]|uniref:Uncharacterized protein n=1 Tax=Natronococcus amylolyticus DSM 10524 TaxID=1227497 RepID=L9X4Z1_9EURY|nr:hypothetical protein [Natronococcus amylolyticus]ELY56496.1 hypothetical protein C491_13192 [Natronococcus amylolyticus DSM 10524]
MSNCSNCGSRPYLCQRCRLKELENRIGTPTDHDIDRWVLENNCWHASTEFDGQTHECACGTEIETPLERSTEDLRYVPEEYDAPVCEDCVTELEGPRRETVPADATFKRASKLVTDGGIDVDAVRAEVPFWIQFQGRRASAIHIPAEDCTRDNPDSACQHERSAIPWTFDPDNIPDSELHARLCKTCAKQVLEIEEDRSKYGRSPADILAENGFSQDNDDRELRTDGGNLEEVYRRETITEGPDGGLQIGDREIVDEIDDVCSALEALKEKTENSEVDAALQSAVNHTWRASILQRVDENTDVRMTTASGPTDTVVHGPDPADYKRERGER